MPKTRPAYAPEFRQQMVELVRAERTPRELAKDFEPSEPTIRSWVAQADLDEGRRADDLTTQERKELARLRRENKQLRKENARLRRRLEQAQTILEIQKKASEILGIPLNRPPADDDA